MEAFRENKIMERLCQVNWFCSSSWLHFSKATGLKHITSAFVRWCCFVLYWTRSYLTLFVECCYLCYFDVKYCAKLVHLLTTPISGTDHFKTGIAIPEIYYMTTCLTGHNQRFMPARECVLYEILVKSDVYLK